MVRSDCKQAVCYLDWLPLYKGFCQIGPKTYECRPELSWCIMNRENLGMFKRGPEKFLKVDFIHRHLWDAISGPMQFVNALSALLSQCNSYVLEGDT